MSISKLAPLGICAKISSVNGTELFISSFQ
jgi:hypothetical protein